MVNWFSGIIRIIIAYSMLSASKIRYAIRITHYLSAEFVFHIAYLGYIFSSTTFTSVKDCLFVSTRGWVNYFSCLLHSRTFQRKLDHNAAYNIYETVWSQFCIYLESVNTTYLLTLMKVPFPKLSTHYIKIYTEDLSWALQNIPRSVNWSHFKSIHVRLVARQLTISRFLSTAGTMYTD